MPQPKREFSYKHVNLANLEEKVELITHRIQVRFAAHPKTLCNIPSGSLPANLPGNLGKSNARHLFECLL